MENQKKELIKWALKEFSTSLKIFEQRWNIFETQPYFDYRVELRIDEFLCKGRGVNTSKDLALTSALAEAIERYAIKFNSINSSNGISLHSNQSEARLNAKLELIERHYVMAYSLGHIENNNIHSLAYAQIAPTIKALNFFGVEFSFLKLNSEKYYTVLCQASGLQCKKPFGLCFGSATKISLEKAIEKSFFEALINTVAHINLNIQAISEDDFQKIISPKPEDHLALYSDVTFAKKYLTLARHQHGPLNTPLNEKFTIQEIFYPYSSLFPVFKASHPDALSAHWGYLNHPNNFNPSFPLVLP
ncbi:YcaO-like family protein [Bacteriovorax stolpii]|nr:YcaO-like family protein [Bacteriovorax stolpii]TDP53131.1 YcaO-like family protein [Bacteriovorax stolpii]